MNWSERLQQHQVHKTLDAVLASLEAVQSSPPHAEHALEALETFTRIQHAARFLRSRLDQVDALLVPQTDLDALHNGLISVKSQVDNYAVDRNLAHLQGASAGIDKWLPRASALPLVTAPPNVESLRTLVEDFHKGSRRLVADLADAVGKTKAETATVQAELGRLREAIQADKARLDKVIAEQQQQFSQAQAARQQTFDNVVKEGRDESTAAHGKWAKQFTEHEKQIKERLDAALKAGAEEQQSYRTARDEECARLTQELEKHLANAKRIVGLIAGTGMAGGYQRDANIERRAYWLWNTGAVLGFVGLIYFAVGLFNATTATTPFGWPQFFGRLLAVGAFGLFAAYAGRIGKGHRESERRHRHKQLALESVNAFLHDIDVETQKSVKQKMAESFFMGEEKTAATVDDATSLSRKDLLELLKAVLKK